MNTPNLPFSLFLRASVMKTASVFGVLFLIIGAVVGMTTRVEGLWLWIWIGGTCGSVYLAALVNQSACKKQMEGTIQFLKDKLQKIDYWRVSRGSGVAVDVDSGKVAIEGIAERKIVHAVVTLDQVRDIQAVEANRTEYTSIGLTSSSTKGEIAKKNFEEGVRAAQNTGLVFKLDDLNTPSIHVILPYSAAERWVLLFQKMVNGTLDASPEPTELPAR